MTSWCLGVSCIVLLAMRPATATPESEVLQLVQRFVSEVDMRLDLPAADQDSYARMLDDAISKAAQGALPSRYVVLVDRNPVVQAIFIFWRSGSGDTTLIGASPVSTGKPGTFDHFLTPLGLFEHSLDNLDFRAEGTRNENGIRGYGRKGMRIFDFGWAVAERGWGTGGQSVMRLQMHATDPDVLESRLGQTRSQGCIRIPSTLNTFLDRYGLLDANYQQAVAAGQRLWVLRSDRLIPAHLGRYLVVVESAFKNRPAWSPLPARRDRQRKPPVPALSSALGLNTPASGHDHVLAATNHAMNRQRASPIGTSRNGA